MMRRGLCLTMAAATLVAVGCFEFGWQWEGEGRDAARRDIANGMLRWHTYGAIGPDTGDIHDAWEEQLGVKVVWVSGCLVDEKTAGTARGYNAEMRQEIDRRFGPRAMERVAQQVRDERLKAYLERQREKTPAPTGGE